jgi:hypothetical protein
MDNINRPDGIVLDIDTDNGPITVFLKFSEMDNESLVEFIMQYPYAMTEWMGRLRKIDAEKRARFEERLKETQTEPEQ